jgi:hypothetical protein
VNSGASARSPNQLLHSFEDTHAQHAASSNDINYVPHICLCTDIANCFEEKSDRKMIVEFEVIVDE